MIFVLRVIRLIFILFKCPESLLSISSRTGGIVEFSFSKGTIAFNKELNELDELVIRFTSILHKLEINYVIVSGYVAIVFGRSRATEDVDLMLKPLSIEKFSLLWRELHKNGFWCVNAFSEQEAFEDFLTQKLAVRFAEEGKHMPNFELKFSSNPTHEYSLRHKIKVILNSKTFYTSSIELQIAYKLYLGSDKDLEDAIHLWAIFKKHLDASLVAYWASELGVKDRLKELE